MTSPASTRVAAITGERRFARAKAAAGAGTRNAWLRPPGNASNAASRGPDPPSGVTRGWGASAAAGTESCNGSPPIAMPVPVAVSQRFKTQRSAAPAPAPSYPTTTTPPRAVHSPSNAKSPVFSGSDGRSGAPPPRSTRVR